MELTEEGARFLPHARELIRVADVTLAAMPAGDRPLRVDLVDNRLAPMFILRRLAEREPDLHVKRSARHGLANSLEPLSHGEIDVAFGRVHDRPGIARRTRPPARP